MYFFVFSSRPTLHASDVVAIQALFRPLLSSVVLLPKLSFAALNVSVLLFSYPCVISNSFFLTCFVLSPRLALSLTVSFSISFDFPF